MGTTLARAGVGLVYGGASVGTMGALADAAMAAGGTVTGVIPRQLVDREIAQTDLSDLRVVDDMHERKAMMAELSDGFIALPGGVGTLEELFEIWTWGQLTLHRKPLGLLDVDGYFAALTAFADHMVAEDFLAPAHREMLHVEAEPQALLDRFADYVPPPDKWAAAPSLLGTTDPERA